LVQRCLLSESRWLGNWCAVSGICRRGNIRPRTLALTIELSLSNQVLISSGSGSASTARMAG
jgi:hypothetical protein